MKREVVLYTTSDGKCPVKEFLDSLPIKVFQKITWVLRLITELDRIPSNYFKKLIDTNNIWECRVTFGSNIYRLLCFIDNGSIVVLTNGFIKKTQKTPNDEIMKAEEYKKDYLKREK
jgi:phage-related protein